MLADLCRQPAIPRGGLVDIHDADLLKHFVELAILDGFAIFVAGDEREVHLA